MIKKGDRMKKIMYILVFFLLSNFVLADTFNIEEIRVYVEDSRQRDAKVSGGSFDGYRDENVKFRVEIDNNYTRNMEDIDIILVAVGIKRNGDDIEVSQENIDINSGDDKTVNLEFTIPSDSIYDYYDIELEIDGDFDNGTHLEDWIQTWDLEVLKKEEEEEEEESKSVLHYYLSNCSAALSMVPTYINCETEKEGIIADKRVAETERDNSQELLTSCRVDLQTYKDGDWKNKYDICVDSKENMILNSTCTRWIKEKEGEKSGGGSGLLVPGLIVGAIILINLFNKRKQQQAEDEMQ